MTREITLHLLQILVALAAVFAGGILVHRTMTAEQMPNGQTRRRRAKGDPDEGRQGSHR
jgi:hypothetical protein